MTIENYILCQELEAPQPTLTSNITVFNSLTEPKWSVTCPGYTLLFAQCQQHSKNCVGKVVINDEGRSHIHCWKVPTSPEVRQ